jgi:hypothetical protein
MNVLAMVTVETSQTHLLGTYINKEGGGRGHTMVLTMATSQSIVDPVLDPQLIMAVVFFYIKDLLSQH